MTVDVPIAYECHEFNNKWSHIVNAVRLHVSGIFRLHVSGIKTAGWINVVLIRNASEWLRVSCPTALTAMAFPAAPAPNIKEKWFGANGLSIYVPKNVTLQIMIGMEVYKSLVNNLSSDERDMGSGACGHLFPGLS